MARWLLVLALTSAALAFSPGPLASAHRDLEGVVSCGKCHAPGPVGGEPVVDPSRCMACHDGVRTQVTVRSGTHAERAEGCETCHPEHRGRDGPLVPRPEAPVPSAPAVAPPSPP